MGLPITRKINISLSKIAAGLAEFAVNNVAIFTNENAAFADTYRNYVDAGSVATDFGSSSLTATMAENIFAQSPNILSGNGQLIIIPLLSSVSATSGTFTTADISANLANFLTVTDGKIKYALNGATAVQLTGLNFTNCITLADVAKVINIAIPDLFIEIVGNTIKFTSKKFGTASGVVFSASPTGGTDIIGTTFLSTSTGTTVAGLASSGETISQAITRTQNAVFYNGIIDTLNVEDSVVTATASTVQAMDKIYLHPVCSTEDIAGLATTISTANQDKTRCLLYTTSVINSKLMGAAYMGRAFSTNFNGSNTTITMDLKDLVNVVSDPIFESTAATTIANACEVAGVDYYTNYGGVTGVSSTGGNDYFDNVYNDIWFKLALEVAGFNYLKQTNTKLPQTEQGMDGLKGTYNKICLQGIVNGAFAAGTWNSSQTVGDPTTFLQNIAQVGYYTYSQPISQQAQADRNARKAPVCQIAAKRAGAVHESDVLVTIEN